MFAFALINKSLWLLKRLQWSSYWMFWRCQHFCELEDLAMVFWTLHHVKHVAKASLFKMIPVIFIINVLTVPAFLWARDVGLVFWPLHHVYMLLRPHLLKWFQWSSYSMFCWCLHFCELKDLVMVVWTLHHVYMLLRSFWLCKRFNYQQGCKFAKH